MLESFRLGLWTMMAVGVFAAGSVESAPRISSARKIYHDTSLKDSETIIVAPAKYKDLAKKIADKIKAVLGENLQVVLDTDVMTGNEENKDAYWKQYNMLIVGSATNNKAMLKVYAEHRCVVDAAYPGKDGYAVRTSDNPFGYQRNVIVIGGSDKKGVEDAVQKFNNAALKDKLNKAGKKIGRLFIVKTNAKETLKGIHPMLMYYMTHDESLRAQARKFHYYPPPRGPGRWRPRKDRNVIFRGFFHILPWYLLDDCPSGDEKSPWTERDRRHITQRILGLSWIGTTYFPKGKVTFSPRPLGNHFESNPCYNGWLMAHYGDKYFCGNTGKWPRIREMEKYMDQNIVCYRGGDDCSTYHNWQGVIKVLDYYSMSDKMDEFIKNGQMKLTGDSVIATVDNQGVELATGDEAYYSPTTYLWWSPPLRRAAMYLDNGGEYVWFYNYCNSLKSVGGSKDTKVIATHRRRLYATDRSFSLFGLYITDKKPVKPTRLLGVFALGLNTFHESVLKRRKAPREQFFDKLTFRKDFSVNDEYMALEGGPVGWRHHGHPDTNAIIRLTWHDKMWLTDTGRIGHSMVTPSGGFATAHMIALGDFNETGLTTTMTKHKQAIWNRNVFWDKSDFFLIIDDLLTTEDRKLNGSCAWRHISGKTKLNPATGVFSSEQDGAKFFIIGDDGSKRSMGKGVLSQKLSKDLKKGEALRFTNLLWAVKAGDSKRYGIKKWDDTCVVIFDGEQSILAGVSNSGRYVKGDLKLEARTFLIKKSYIAATQCKSIEIGGTSILKSDKPVEVEIDWSKQKGRLSAMFVHKEAKATLAKGITGNNSNNVTVTSKEEMQKLILKVEGKAPAGLSQVIGSLPKVEPITETSVIRGPR